MNQLDLITEQVRKLDSRLSKTEQDVKNLFENNLVQRAVQKFENNNPQFSHTQGSIWESFKQKQNEELAQLQTQNIFQQGALANTTSLQEDFLVSGQQEQQEDDDEEENDGMSDDR